MKTVADYLIEEYGAAGIATHWGKRNSLSPFEISAATKTKYWFVCDKTDYHGEYEQSAGHYTKGVRCPYCALKKVHPRDSFAQVNIDKYGEDFLENYWDYEKNILDPWCIAPATKKKIWLKCEKKKHPSYEVPAYSFKSGCGCPYCANKKICNENSLAGKFPESVEIWSDKNDVSPYSISPYSHKKYYWKCHKGVHKDYVRNAYNSIRSGFLCPECQALNTISHLQRKVSKYISQELKLPIEHEYNCSLLCRSDICKWPFPYDNDILLPNEKHLIIEVHGAQHYVISHFAVKTAELKQITPEEVLLLQQQRDQIKKTYALERGYFYLEIPYTAEKDGQYKALIDQKIEECMKNESCLFGAEPHLPESKVQ